VLIPLLTLIGPALMETARSPAAMDLSTEHGRVLDSLSMLHLSEAITAMKLSAILASSTLTGMRRALILATH